MSTDYTNAEERYTVERARAVLLDHAAGLHEESVDPTVGCLWPGCEEAYTIVGRVEEARIGGTR